MEATILTNPSLSSVDTMASAFFYGILIHPKILKRVLDNDASHLQICPAVLTVGPFPPPNDSWQTHLIPHISGLRPINTELHAAPG